jgi:hypothetical protein
MLLDLSSGDPIIGYIKWISAFLIVLAPWLIVRTDNNLVRKSTWIIWYLAILMLSALYLGLLTYHYMGIQLGFNHEGNPMDRFMILCGIISIVPFIVAAKKGLLPKPFQVGVMVAFGLLILIGPALYNSVALSIFTQGGGEFDPGSGDYSGEVYTPVDSTISWTAATNIGLFVCNLIPLLVLVSIWKIGSQKSVVTVQSIE